MSVKFLTYKITEEDKNNLLKLAEDNPKVSPYVIKALYHRGINTQDKLDEFFDDNYRNIKSAREFKDCDKMIDELIKTKDNNEIIVIMGDYDCDGSLGSTISYLTLFKLGYSVFYHVNTREIGYGLKIESVDKIIELYPNVKTIFTVDNGITSFDAVDYANSKGIKVLITDHHKSTEELPNAKAIVNPNRFDCTSKTKNNCGAIVAWKVLFELVKTLGRDDLETFMFDLLDLGSIATVADQVTLLGDNRLIVKHGLKLLNRRNRFSLSIMLDVLGIKDSVDEDTLGFYLGPMINSVNRMDGNVLSLIRTLILDYDDKDYIEDFALKMGAMNNTRKGITNCCFEQVSSRLDESRYDALFYGEPDPIGNCLVLNDKDIVEGISGILASKLLDKYNRPVLVMTDCGNGKLKGSARSLYPVDIKKVFDEISDVFISYGGHAYSAGFTLEESQFHNLDYKLNEKLSYLNPNDFTKHVYIDVILSGKLEDSSICDVFDCMAPFGQGFPKPMFMYKNFVVDKQKTNANKTNSPYVGKDGKTLRLVNNDRLVAIMFKYADKYKTMLEPGVVNLVGRPVINEYNGYRNIQFMVEEDYIIKVK